MTLAQYQQISNYAVASATVVLGLAFIAYVAQWGFARNVAPDHALVGSGADVAPSTPLEDADRSDVAGGIGLSLTGLAWFVLLVGVVARGLSAQRVPWGNMYEFGCAGILVVLSAYLVLVRVWGIDWVGPIITGFGMVVLGLSALVWVPAGPLVPALHSYWLVIHVLGAMIAGSAFLVGAAASVLFLVKSGPSATRRRGPGRLPVADPAVGQDRPGRLPGPRLRLPDLDVRGPHRRADLGAVRLGPLLGLGPQGGLGVHHLGRLRGLPARPRHRRLEGQGRRDHRPRRLRDFLFNFVGINLFIPGLHSYAK